MAPATQKNSLGNILSISTKAGDLLPPSHSGVGDFGVGDFGVGDFRVGDFRVGDFAPPPGLICYVVFCPDCS